jgi:hypothetical protein
MILVYFSGVSSAMFLLVTCVCMQYAVRTPILHTGRRSRMPCIVPNHLKQRPFATISGVRCAKWSLMDDSRLVLGAINATAAGDWVAKNNQRLHGRLGQRHHERRRRVEVGEQETGLGCRATLNHDARDCVRSSDVPSGRRRRGGTK